VDRVIEIRLLDTWVEASGVAVRYRVEEEGRDPVTGVYVDSGEGTKADYLRRLRQAVKERHGISPLVASLREIVISGQAIIIEDPGIVTPETSLVSNESPPAM